MENIYVEKHEKDLCRAEGILKLNNSISVFNLRIVDLGTPLSKSHQKM